MLFLCSLPKIEVTHTVFVFTTRARGYSHCAYVHHYSLEGSHAVAVFTTIARG